MADAKKWEGHPRLRTAGEKLPPAEKITDEGMERRKFRANKPFYPKGGMVYFNNEATRDTIRHFVDGIGDDNPLFRDEEYAQKTKYGSIIAPGSFLYTNMWGAQVGSGFAGVHAWYSGGEWEWYRPIFPGTAFRNVTILRDVEVKKGRMTGANIYIDYGDVVYLDPKGEVVAKERSHTVWAERELSGSAGKERGVSKVSYSREDWVKILEMYDSWKIRGSEPRYWEDVQVGDKIGHMIKGPLSVRDILAWLMGGGSPFFRAHKMEYMAEMKHPKLLEYVEELGEADVPELVHIFDAYARTIGVERAYDYGNQRMSWLCQLFSDWMGDDGFLWKMSGDERAFNQVGDITTFEGEVTKKYIEEGKCCVDIEAGARNQRDEWSMPPRSSTVVLPSREHGPVVYPNPSPELVEEVKRARPLEDMIKEGVI